MTMILLQRGKDPLELEADPVCLADLRAEHYMEILTIRFESGIPLGWMKNRQAIFLTSTSRFCLTGPRKELRIVEQFVMLAQKYTFYPLTGWAIKPAELARMVTKSHLVFVASEDIQAYQRPEMFAHFRGAALPSPAELAWRVL